MNSSELTQLVADCWCKPKKTANLPEWHRKVALLLKLCYNDPVLFNTAVLGRQPYWYKQVEMSKLVVDNEVSIIVSGNAVGKSWWLAGMVLWYLYTRPNSVVVSTSPVFSQLTGVLWENIRMAWRKSKIPLGGTITGKKASPQQIKLDDGWFAIGVATTATERISGYRSSQGNTLVVVDEASALNYAIVEGLFSLSADKQIYIGNPLRADGPFLDMWNSARRGEVGYGGLRISSLESPDIGLWKSSRGMACKSWLDMNRALWGDSGAWWQSHVLAEFPSDNAESLIQGSWLDLCNQTTHKPAGPKRLALDLAGGKNGDTCVALVRDDNGILEIRHSKEWNFEQAAAVVNELRRKYIIPDEYIAFDQGGLGHDFANRLLVYGITNAYAYVGSRGGNSALAKKFKNLRTLAAHRLSRRLDPKRVLGVPTENNPPLTADQFYISTEHLQLLRRELQGLSLKNEINQRVELEGKDSIKKRLGHSCDFADALIISYSFKFS